MEFVASKNCQWTAVRSDFMTVKIRLCGSFIVMLFLSRRVCGIFRCVVILFLPEFLLFFTPFNFDPAIQVAPGT